MVRKYCSSITSPNTNLTVHTGLNLRLCGEKPSNNRERIPDELFINTIITPILLSGFYKNKL
jgi:hypothetical protein